jgi:hypothetical protein
MKTIIIIIGGFLIPFVAVGQLNCIISAPAEIELSPSQKSGGNYTHKVIRVNIHYTLKTNGTGNFTETGDGQGNSLNGYQFAKDMIRDANNYQTTNPPMNLHTPPNTSTPNPDKEYEYILEAVYFHRNDYFYNYSSINSLNYQTIGEHTDSLVNVFIIGQLNGGSHVLGSSMSHTSKNKFTELSGVYKRYLEYLNNIHPGDSYVFVTGSSAKTIIHEIGHLLGLNHTMLYSNGAYCPNISSTTCGDNCADTPTRYQAYTTNGIDPNNSNCWNASLSYCSNNMMDYNNVAALTTCQLDIIHAGLDGGMASYKQCSAVYDDLNICNLGYPYVVYNGQNVTLGQCTSGALLSGNEEMTIHFSESVDISNFEVRDGTEFEAIFISKCN